MAKRGGKRRDPAREKFWRRTIRQQQRSGLAVRDFCRREGLKDWTFRWWRQELARRDRAALGRVPGEREGEPTEAAPRLPAGAGGRPGGGPAPARPPDRDRAADRPDRPGPSGFDPRTLGHVLAVLEGRPC